MLDLVLAEQTLDFWEERRKHLLVQVEHFPALCDAALRQGLDGPGAGCWLQSLLYALLVGHSLVGGRASERLRLSSQERNHVRAPAKQLCATFWVIH